MEETPEQIAHKIAAAWIMGPINMGDLQERIADAIRLALQAQRERDAGLCDALLLDPDWQGHTAVRAALYLAAAIRAQS